MGRKKFFLISLLNSEISSTFAESKIVELKNNGMNNDSKQEKGKRKSLPQEACIKTINGERHGAVAGNASAKNLNQSGSERLNRFALTHSDSAAKLKQKTETTKKKSKISSTMAILSTFWKSNLVQMADGSLFGET